ncbi:HAD family hydrolase [Lactobacillus sp. Sy-1]|uniref:HAD family hydrolase n=1 Tax=Lactobacillus sp. Sy-1 TaxID=2109645 RepID=UPI001C5B8CA3|nr:HAD-IA family hydrolase [Lactobacillus sp. Sy-1]MBW1605920.1 HAD-IA family hydrolase [Lactobacillus sp. Sy-1]
MQNYIFDFDLTLIDSGRVNVLSTQSAFDKMGWPKPSADAVSYYTGIPIETSFPKMAPQNASQADLQKLIKVFVKEYEKLEPGNLQLFPGIKEVLAKLRADGKQLFVATSNRSEVVIRNMKALGVLQYFTEIVGFDMVEKAKPAPDTVLKIIADHHLKKDETIMIGDATFDLEMGKNAGVHTAGVIWGAHDTEALKMVHPDYLLDQVPQLLDIK